MTSTHAWLLAYLGRHAEAAAIVRRTVELNPADWTAGWALAVTLAYAGKPAEAAEVERVAIARAPVVPVLYSWLAMILIQLAELDAAANELRIAEQLVGDTPDIATLTNIATVMRALDVARTRRASSPRSKTWEGIATSAPALGR